MAQTTHHSPLADVLREALVDEYRAISSYQKIIEVFGAVRPFVNIIEAERAHVNALLPLFEKYGIPIPDDTGTTDVQAPGSILEACRAGVEAEKANVAMYDRLLSAIASPDVRAVLLRLQEASRERHLPAFERCVLRESGGCNGPGRGAGGGRQRRRGTGRGRS